DEAARAAVLGAELWGADVLQPLARRVFWGAAKRSPRSISSYQAASQLPRLPKPILRVVFPPVARLEIAMHGADDDALRADRRAPDWRRRGARAPAPTAGSAWRRPAAGRRRPAPRPPARRR